MTPDPVFCKVCGTFIGHLEEDDKGLVFWPILLGTVSVAECGWYCSGRCKRRDPEYHRVMGTRVVA